jgi:AcrR family transcriptional regulator
MLKEENSRQERVVNAAWEIFARFGYRKASMQDIAEAADVSKSVLFKYHGTKENLYRAVFWRASEEIAKADAAAKAGRMDGETVFAAMRRTVDIRMRLFAESPYLYAFSYAAAYDDDPLPKALFTKALQQAEAAGSGETAYRGLRDDLLPSQAKQLIFWISNGFLADQLALGMTEPERVRQEYLDWIDVMERLMTRKGNDE